MPKKGYKQTAEHRANSRAGNRTKHVGMKGKFHTKETIEKIRIASRNRVHTLEARAKMSAVKIGNKYCLGRKLTQETIEKIRITSRKRVPTPETRAKMSTAQMGKRGEKANNWRGGKIDIVCILCGKTRKVTPSCIKPNKMNFCSRGCASKWKAKNIRGEKHPQWKGGISCEPYCDIWLDKEYKDSIRKRDNYKCQNPDCWNTIKTKHSLSIHHIDYIKTNCHPNNLITICLSCNSRANANREWHMAYYNAIMQKKNESDMKLLEKND